MLTTETGLLGGAGLVIAWLVAELVRRKKEYDTDKAERQKLHEAHAADLKDQIKAYREGAERHQEFYENFTEQARIQERASMTVIASVSERMATLTAVVSAVSK